MTVTRDHSHLIDCPECGLPVDIHITFHPTRYDSYVVTREVLTVCDCLKEQW